MKTLKIEITETDDGCIAFDMPVSDFCKAEVTGFLSQLTFQLNYQLLESAKKKSRKKPTK